MSNVKTEKNILIAFILNISFSIFEIVGGIFTGSIAILSDSLHDFGDALRSLFTGDNECSKDLSKLKVDYEIFKQYLIGYATKMKNTLTKKEKELLPFSIFLMPNSKMSAFCSDMCLTALW